MNTRDRIENYIEKHSKWESELRTLRAILNDSLLEENVKWGAPNYSFNGKNVVGLAAFKNHIAIWFHQGVFLKDKAGKLVNANKDTTRGLRQWRFSSGDEIDAELIGKYISEAIENEKAGKKISPKTKKVEVPDELKIAFQNNAGLLSDYKKLTPGRQREYCAYIGEAKQEKTRLSRLEKCIPLIEAGKSLYEKYKK